MYNFGGFGGINVTVSDSLPSVRRLQVRFPRSKRKRIRKKWRTNLDNWRWIKEKYVVRELPSGDLVVNQAYFDLLKRQFAEPDMVPE